MLSLIIVSLVAGICLGQQGGQFSECDTVANIGSECASAHLGYLQQNDEAYVKMQQLGMISLPNEVVPLLDDICNDTVELNNYYVCVYTNLSACFDAKEGTTQQMGLPDSQEISKGVVDLCKVRGDMDQMCIMKKVTEVQKCFGEAFQDKQQGSDPCTPIELLVNCADALKECNGGSELKNFVVSSRPRTCPDPSSAPAHTLPSLLTLLVATVLARYFLSFQ